MSWPWALALPTVLACTLRSLRSSSARTCHFLRASSSAPSRSTSSLNPRRARLAATAPGSDRSNLGSSMAANTNDAPIAPGRSLAGCRSSLRVGLLAAFALLLSALQRLGDLDFEAARHGPIVLTRGHSFGEVVFAGGIGIRLVVRVTVILAVSQLLHQARRGIAQV